MSRTIIDVINDYRDQERNAVKAQAEQDACAKISQWMVSHGFVFTVQSPMTVDQLLADLHCQLEVS